MTALSPPTALTGASLETEAGDGRPRPLAPRPSRRRVADPPVRDVVVPATAPSLSRRRRREAAHRRRTLLTDTVAIAAASGGAIVAQPGAVPLGAAMATAAVWWAAVAASRSRDPLLPLARELALVAASTGAAFGAMAIAAIAFDLPLGPQLAAAPVGLAAMLALRLLWRGRLNVLARGGEHLVRAVVVGAADEVDGIERAMGATAHVRVAGRVVFDGRHDTSAVVRRTVDAVRMLSADTVVIAGCPSDRTGFVRRLAWAVEGMTAEVMLWSGLADLPPRRVAVHWSGELPLLRVAQPAFDARRIAKRAIDVTVAALALVPLALASLPIALAIRADSPGPVLFRQTRVGRGGRAFRMLKFRSMSVHAESERTALLDANDAAGPLFKVRDDPRITRVGRVLRRYSVDELPQLWNVLVGDMSLVGPRPALPDEVAGYDEDEARRLFVRPGLTGPWQVSGRSDLSWDQGIRLDLGYVESRTISGDLRLLLRTVDAVLRPRGAY